MPLRRRTDSGDRRGRLEPELGCSDPQASRGETGRRRRQRRRTARTA